MRVNPQLGNLDPELLKKLDLNNPVVRGAMLDLNSKLPPGKAPSLEDMQRLRKLLAAFERDMLNWQKLNKNGIDGGFWPKGLPAPPPSMPPAPPPEAAAADIDRLTEWTRDLLKDMDNSHVGDFLGDSPAWQLALTDFERMIRMPEGRFDWVGKQVDGFRLPDNLRLPEGLTSRLGDWSLGRLPELNLPHRRSSARKSATSTGALPTWAARASAAAVSPAARTCSGPSSRSSSPCSPGSSTSSSARPRAQWSSRRTWAPGPSIPPASRPVPS